MRTLTPGDVNHFRAQSLLALDDAQCKTGKSRKKTYVMFLERIRASLRLVADIFGDETETAKQNKLASVKWRSMTNAERQVKISVFVAFIKIIEINNNIVIFCTSRAGVIRNDQTDVRGRHKLTGFSSSNNFSALSWQSRLPHHQNLLI